MASEDTLHGHADLANGGVSASGVNRQREKIAISAGAIFERDERRLDAHRITFALESLQFFQLTDEHGGVVDSKDWDVIVVLHDIAIDPDQTLATAVDASLSAGRRFLDPTFWQSRADGPCHAAGRFNLADMGERAGGEIMGQAFDVIGATPEVDDARNAAFGLEKQLSVSSDPG